jgi:glycosyltransferase involved in cell wall biosynthesis
MVTVIVPAHDEAAVLGRLLGALTGPANDDAADPCDLDIVVVANGCTDETAVVAAAVPGVRVVQTPVAGKTLALRLGDEVARGFPRVYIDADVEISRTGVLALAAALHEPGVLVAAPRRVLARAGVPLLVRWYYDVWERLPGVREGVFGRGVIALSPEGHARVRALPDVMADDLAISSAFRPAERRIVDDVVSVVRPPRTSADLLRRRVRAATSTHQLYSSVQDVATDSRTTRKDLARLAVRDPRLAAKLPFFLAVGVLARARAGRALAAGDYTTWLRDESSRDCGDQ